MQRDVLDHGELSFQNVLEILGIINESRWGEVEIEANGTTLKFTRSPERAVSPSIFGGQKSEAPNKSTKLIQLDDDGPGTSQAAGSPESPNPQIEQQVNLDGAVAVYPPMAGIFYSAPSPGTPNFVEIGDRVTQGQQIGIVEVMKLFTPVVSPCSGSIKEILVGNEVFVQNDQVIMLVEQDGE